MPRLFQLSKFGFTPQEDIIPATAANERNGLIQIFRGPFFGWSIATTVYDEKRLSRIFQGNEQRVIAPYAIVRYSHPLLALARGCDNRAVSIDARSLLEECAQKWKTTPFAETT